MKILFTGASGMLGHYLKQVFDGEEITTIGRNSANDIICDLAKETPDLQGLGDLDLVVHAAGTFRESEALDVNFEGTKRLLSALEGHKIASFVYISSTDVYGRLEGEAIDETFSTVTRDKVGQSKYLAEEELRRWSDISGAVLTILRPATMLGKGVKGWIGKMYNQVADGTYVHIRDTKGLRSLVTALDVARVVKDVYRHGGLYNVTDGRDHELVKIAEAMSANRGEYKRMWTLPMKWAALAARIGLGSIMNKSVFEERKRCLTFSSERLHDACNIAFYNTLEVVARTAPDYPYEDE